jgi:hypothetical protein
MANDAPNPRFAKRVEIITQIYELANARRVSELEPLLGYAPLRRKLTWFFERTASAYPDLRFVASNFREMNDTTVSFKVELSGMRLAHEPALQAMRFKGETPIDHRNIFDIPSSANATAFGSHHVRSPLLTDVFDKITEIPGFFTVDDCAHFSLILSTQSSLGFRGDVLEIGSYYGRSTAVIAAAMQTDEVLVVCDLFELEGSDVDYSLTGKAGPSAEGVRENIARVRPASSGPRVEIHRCFSSDIPVEPGPRFRFVHVDGGHDEEIALADLRFCADRLLPGGVISVDDYAHLYYPGVTAAVDRFLAERSDFYVLADINRITETGRKIYLSSRRPRVA